MKAISKDTFNYRIFKKYTMKPLGGQVELTYRCNLNCIHCYCSGQEKKELNTKEFKKIFDELARQGCLWLTLTGGDPLVRDDFLELYCHAKKKGFIVTVFTNGIRINKKVIGCFKKISPFCVEITLNGITRKTYESITQVKGSFKKVISAIKELKKQNIPLVLKSNCLKENYAEIPRIKAFSQKLLANPKEKEKYYFKYDTMIYPGLNSEEGPKKHRLQAKELIYLRKKDPEIWSEFEKGLHMSMPNLKRSRDYLYHCNSWMKQFFIDPSGRLKFCAFSDKYSIDLKNEPFEKGFYQEFPKLLTKRFKTNSKCRACKLRSICYYCPARAYLETRNEEGPVPYYCELAEAIYKERSE